MALKPLNLLTGKPVIYVFNVSESQLQNQEETKKKIESMAPKTAKNETADAEELERLGKYWREREEPPKQDDPLARLREYKKKRQGDWGGK